MAAGLKSRTIVATQSLDRPDQLAYAREQSTLGDRHRYIEDPPGPMTIADRKVAFVVLDPCDVESGGFLIRQPGLVATLVDLFEVTWWHARVIDNAPLTASEREVLEALATYSKDEVAAHALNISVRKYRAHVADLMRRLGATNRFQAALRAKEHGWL